MAAEKGRSFLLKVSDGTSPVTYSTVSGQRSTSMAINGEAVDITNKDGNGWRDLMEGAGIRSVSISASGVFKDSAAEDLVRTFALNQSLELMEVVFESGDKFGGTFQVVNLEYTGEYNGARMYSLTIESSGTVTFTAV